MPPLVPPQEAVPGFPIRYVWQTEWVPLFDRQVEYIRGELRRAVAQDCLVVYLSCPISGRGGGQAGTNVQIAKFTERRLLARLGERFWILNPASYQMESKEGTGLVREHARALGMTDAQLAGLPPPQGGDYMRMWTKVLVENRLPGAPDDQVGDFFDMYYFLGPSDVAEFFLQGSSASLTSAVETYFARKFATDEDFHRAFAGGKDDWEKLRKDFFRYYASRASVNFSAGSHDEWNILRLLNERRRRTGISEQIGSFFDGRQLDPVSTEVGVSPGYAR